jgi:hypothetical protein
VNDPDDVDLVRRERSWNRKSTTWVWGAGAVFGALSTPLIIRFRQTHPQWTDTEILLAAMAAGVVLSIPAALWIERERRRQPAGIFGPRAAELQIDHLQHRLGRALLELVVAGVVIFVAQEALATGRLGPPFVAGEPYGPYWVIVLSSVFTTARAAWSLTRLGWAPAKLHPHMAVAMQDERVQAARLAALRRAYPAVVGAAALAYGVVAIQPGLARYALPVVLLLAVAIPALLWRAALRADSSEAAG